ncbi:tRNA pseudouridine synthase B [Candidatus Fokinia solitaria]|uniref:tRNA pseudouridine synthase B n=1 Tax=Candidatus Fokinia solitaria TaxID=1802984 RepID=A0A2U8BSG0_9RICK|nr:tRNA pseudouridine(55) synthase TruB [Candidatus Fokinia solitaria]AWD33245.1 tRNA pseudouridine synthase B [Candidatus Fokinia solitaria]
MAKELLKELFTKGCFLFLDKAQGFSSHNALYSLRRLVEDLCLPIKLKVGHGGTLDPLASGILLVAIGKATKLLEYCPSFRKSYDCIVEWQKETDTDDAMGKVVKSCEQVPTEEEIVRILPSFKGTVSQVPPDFSAIKVDGVRLYQKARNGQKITKKPRLVQCYDIKLEKIIAQTKARFKIECGSGYYVRSFAKEIARKLNTYGNVHALRRTDIGTFTISDTLSQKFIYTLWRGIKDATLDKELTEYGLHLLCKSLIPVSTLFNHFSHYVYDGDYDTSFPLDYTKLRITHQPPSTISPLIGDYSEKAVLFSKQNELIAVLNIVDDNLKVEKLLF